MLFGEVDIPDQLVEARREGNLVVFAGAGASKGVPSELPGFRGLVKRVAEGDPEAELENLDNKRFDRFLGELHGGGDGVDVHGIVQREIDDPESEPTELHYELLRLFDDASQLRLVTTNFDRHFTTAAEDLFDEEVPHYYAPTLPPGGDFSGIAYLHGSVEQDADELVITDEDFSRAYITQGWARRFLQRLFANYYVLFVGYSHGEAVIEYLARGIPATDLQGRFALEKGWEVPDEDSTDWEYLGIEPIFYPEAEEENEHAELPRALRVWNRYAKQTARERAEHIQKLIAGGPSELSTQQKDVLIDRLKTSEGAQRFAQNAEEASWLHWAFSQGLLDGLFEADELSSPTKKLSEWVGSRLLREHPDQVLPIVGPKANRLNREFWKSIVRGLWKNKETDDLSPAELARWIQVLLVSPPAQPHLLSLVLAEGLRIPEDSESALLIFEYLTEPISEFRKGFKVSEEESSEASLFDQSDIPDTRHEVTIRDNSPQVPRAWREVFEPQIEEFAVELEGIAATHLEKLYHLYDSVDETLGSGESPVGFHRSAVEPHPQDEKASLHEGADVLVNAARESLNWIIRNDPQKGSAIIQRWEASETPLLRRLAVHGMTEHPGVEANDKVDWILDRGWVFSRTSKHEVFRLLGRAYPEADDDCKRELLERIWEEWPDDEEEHRKHKAYRVYNLVHWLADHADECSLVEARLERIHDEFPDFEPREHPDLDHWMGSGGFVQPEDYSEDLLRRAPGSQFDRILNALQGQGLTSEDSLDRDDVQTAIAQSSDWGFDLLEEMAQREIWGEDTWQPIWRGLTETELHAEDWRDVFRFIESNPTLHSHATGIGRLLEKRASPEGGDLPFSELDTAERIADSVAEEAREKPSTVGGGADLRIKLLNHPGASITIFYVYALWMRANEEGLNRLPDGYRERLNAILSDEHLAAQAGQMVLGSRVQFFYNIDPEWTLERLLPYFSWDEEGVGRRVWIGHLFTGLPLGPGLAEVMKEACRSTFSRVTGESEEFRRRFAKLVAGLATSDAIDPMEGGWLPQYLAEAKEDRVRWANEMATILRDSDPARVEQIWNDWLRDYWRLRLDGKPSLTPKEIGRMVNWLPDLEPVLDEAVEMVIQGQPPEWERTPTVFYRTDDTSLGRAKPEAVTQLLQFLLRSAENFQSVPHRFVSSTLHDIASTEDCPQEGFENLVDRAVELQYIDLDEGDDLIQRC